MIRRSLRLAAGLLAMAIGWVWAGNSGLALGLLWWRTPTFFEPHIFCAPQRRLGLHSRGGQGIWLCSWVIYRQRPSDFAQANSAEVLVYADEMDASDFARTRREWLGRVD